MWGGGPPERRACPVNERERERACRKEGKEEAEADQSPAEPKTVDERSRECVSPLSFLYSS